MQNTGRIPDSLRGLFQIMGDVHQKTESSHNCGLKGPQEFVGEEIHARNLDNMRRMDCSHNLVSPMKQLITGQEQLL